TGYNADTPQLYFDLDRAKAESLGVPVSTIFSTLQSKLASFYVNDFNLQGYAFNVKIQSDILDRGTIDDINNIEIPNKNGEMVPLNALGRVSYIVGPRQIQRFNKLISADMKAQGNGISSGELMNLIETVPLPEGYTINWTDMSYQERENQGQIVFLMGLAMLFAYLFLVAQYESWTVPVPVMLSVLFATLGALIGLKLWGEPLSIYAQLGLVMLVGLAAKNAILMVEFSKQERENGVPIFEAAVNGANLRYRAVLMTAWSFIFGVYPLVIATGAGAGSRRAIGIPTFSGMLFATFVGLFFVPALYAACQRAREYVNSKLFRKQ
ncbi:MAG: efflux RND transporter permease subunit, partial [Lentisphaeria bacterium]|nr:efflux RND transporter permease subunit [Lentisphaeria bacterium]